MAIADRGPKAEKSLPAIQQYQFGFDQGGDLSSVRADLVRSYEDLSQAWVNHRSEYLQFVEQCVTKNMRAYKQLSYYADNNYNINIFFNWTCTSCF